jgi:hypothetical protein
MFKLTHGLPLPDKLLTAINAVFVPIEPLPRMLFLGAILGQKASVNHFTTARTVTDGWVRAAVIHVWAGAPLHFCFLLSIQIYGFHSISAISMRGSLLLKGVMTNAVFPTAISYRPIATRISTAALLGIVHGG